MKTRVLVFCGDPWHPAETVRRGLAAFRDFDFEFPENDAADSDWRLDDFSLVILAKANLISAGNPQPWLTPDSPTKFFDFVRGGGGLLAIHAGTSRYEKLPLMRALIGGAFVRHPEPCDVTFESKKDLPTNGIAPFTIRDEHYFVETNPDVEIFLESRSSHGVQPAGWTRTEGHGRVCVLTPGHDLEVWLNAEFQKLLLNALRWAAKNELKHG